MNTEPKLKPKVTENGKYTIGIFITFMLLMLSSLSLTGFLLFSFYKRLYFPLFAIGFQAGKSNSIKYFNGPLQGSYSKGSANVSIMTLVSEIFISHSS